MDKLKIRHNVVVDTPAPSTAECGWCATRKQLATMPDGASRMPGFAKLVASSAGRRRPCVRCTKAALDVVKRRVRRRPKDTGGATSVSQGTRRMTSAATRSPGASPRARVASPGKRKQLTASATPAAQHVNCVICGGYPSQTSPHPPWFTSALDHDRWVAVGRPKRWPA